MRAYFLKATDSSEAGLVRFSRKTGKGHSVSFNHSVKVKM